MEYGLHMPVDGPLATPDTLVSLAQRTEALGFSIITAGDHIVTPMNIESAYPYTRSGRARARPDGDWLENLTPVGIPCGPYLNGSGYCRR